VDTDDFGVIHLPPGWTTERLVDSVLSASRNKVPHPEVVATLTALGMSRETADFVMDRCHGGVFRAGVRTPSATPAKDKRSIEWVAYRRGLREPALVAELFPTHFPRPSGAKRWWQFWK
jgi:hypothetical protein